VTTLIIATGNAHKVDEIRSILGEDFRYLTLKDFPDAPEAIEDGCTFPQNAEKKARSLVDWLNETGRSPDERAVVLADDSGLEVDALDGAPGVHSARFAAGEEGAEGNSSDAGNNAKLLSLLENVFEEKRTARFRCVIAALNLDGGAARFADGACEGTILRERRGQGGFGYDPLFVPAGDERSFAELSEAEKNVISHRRRALAGVQEILSDLGA
jgi:XTP/dITP diphosphohydrolase